MTLGKTPERFLFLLFLGNSFLLLGGSIHMPMDIEAIYNKYGPMVFRRCMSLLKDEAEAEDITQMVFMRLIEKQELLTDEYPSSLLWSMTTRLCLNRIRDRKRRGLGTGGEMLDQITCFDDFESRSLAENMLDKLFQKEPASSQTIAVLHFIDGMTYEEVAREMGMSVSGIRKRLRNLRSRLQQMEALP